MAVATTNYGATLRCAIVYQRFFFTGDLATGFFAAGLADALAGTFFALDGSLGGGAVTLEGLGGTARIRHLGLEPMRSSRCAAMRASRTR